jgi:hypothetical protein
VGALTVALEDDSGNGIDPNELARVNDAMTYLNKALGGFGVSFTWAAPGTPADVTVHFASNTPYGGASAGVLGFTTAGQRHLAVTGRFRQGVTEAADQHVAAAAALNDRIALVRQRLPCRTEQDTA